MMQQMLTRNNAIDSSTIKEIDNKIDKSHIKSEDTSVSNLDHYIYELENRSETKFNNYCNNQSITQMCESDEISLFSQLAQKDKDLILAAELGKALLDRNEELSRANEKITEEYSHKLELLEQEKYGLRRKLDSLEGEYESRVSELQSDLFSVKKELDSQLSYSKQSEHERNKIVQELVEQNHRLTSQLKQSTETESLLESQLQSLRDQFQVRRTNLNDHIDQLEGLREEINLLTKRKSDLERRISSLTEDRENLNVSLEESSDRIFLLEKQLQEQEIEIRTHQKDLEELRHANSQLHNKLDSCMRKNLPSDMHNMSGHHSLFNEIEMSSQSSNDEDLRSFNGQIGSYSPDDEIECDDRDSSFSSCHSDCWKLKQEFVDIYQQLRLTCHDLQRKKENSGNFNSTQDSGLPTPEEIHINQLRVGMLRSVFRDLQSLLNDSHLDCNDMPCLSCQTLADDRHELEKLRKEVTEQTDEIHKKTEEINKMTKQLTIQETELNAIREERDLLKSDINSVEGMAKDEIVKRAWDVRDQAVARKNVVEVELAKTRIEVMHINSQLLETIQQKIELSQQLEQWQVDLQILLDEQLKKKLTTQEQGDKRRNADIPNVGSNFENNNKSAQFVSRGTKFLRLWRYN